jgi:hypothetical protein
MALTSVRAIGVSGEIVVGDGIRVPRTSGPSVPALATGPMGADALDDPAYRAAHTPEPSLTTLREPEFFSPKGEKQLHHALTLARKHASSVVWAPQLQALYGKARYRTAARTLGGVFLYRLRPDEALVALPLGLDLVAC